MNDQAIPMLAGPDMEAAVQAYRELLQLNWDSWKPEVAEWLHSEDAEPVLKELLAAVPSPAVLH